MKRSQVWGGVALATMLCSRASFAAAELSGPDILGKCGAAYKALPGYVGLSKTYEVTQVQYDAEDGEKPEVQTLKASASARIQYASPAQLNIVGKDLDGLGFTVICQGKDGWVAWEREAKGTFAKALSSESAIAKMSGVAVHAPSSVTSLLLGREWGNPILQPETAKLSGHEKVDGMDCYKVANPTSVRTDTFWVDSKTFLLRRYQRAETETQLKQAEAMEADAAQTFVRDDPPQDGTKSRMRTESYIIESTQAPADKTVFAAPRVGTKPAPLKG